MSKRCLGIDDCRELSFCSVLARTYHDGIRALKFYPKWDELYLDHDLGAVQTQFTESGRELTGYDVLCFLEENPEYLPKEIILVTSNPVGREKMQKLIEKLYAKPK